MTLTEQKKRRGVFILWSAATIADLAEPDENDLLLAIVLWQRLAPTAAQQLVGARPMNSPASAFNIARPGSVYRWNQDALKYVNPDGRFVSAGAVKQSVNTFVRDAGDELGTLTRRMTDGEIAIEEWQAEMGRQVKSIHTAVDVVAQGGIAQVTTQDVKRIAKGVDFQLKRLMDFSESLSDLSSFRVTVPAVSDDAATARAKLYAATARSTFEESVVSSWQDLADTGVRVEMRNVLADDAEHCHAKGATPGCVEESARGWVTLGTMSLPGRRSCKSGCLCRTEFRRKPPNLN